MDQMLRIPNLQIAAASLRTIPPGIRHPMVGHLAYSQNALEATVYLMTRIRKVGAKRRLRRKRSLPTAPHVEANEAREKNQPQLDAERHFGTSLPSIGWRSGRLYFIVCSFMAAIAQYPSRPSTVSQVAGRRYASQWALPHLLESSKTACRSRGSAVSLLLKLRVAAWR